MCESVRLKLGHTKNRGENWKTDSVAACAAELTTIWYAAVRCIFQWLLWLRRSVALLYYEVATLLEIFNQSKSRKKNRMGSVFVMFS